MSGNLVCVSFLDDFLDSDKILLVVMTGCIRLLEFRLKSDDKSQVFT